MLLLYWIEYIPAVVFKEFSQYTIDRSFEIY